MIIETNRSLTEAEAKEITTVIMNARQLIKNPTKKISSIFRFCRRGANFLCFRIAIFLVFPDQGRQGCINADRHAHYHRCRDFSCRVL